MYARLIKNFRHVVDKFYDTISETIVLNVTSINNYDYMYNNQEKI